MQKTYLAQIGKILDIDKVEVRWNSEWFKKMSFVDIIGLTSKFTVARLNERDDFEKRMKAGVEVHMHELLYPMMQAYDSVMVEADVEIGSTDQMFNILAGRELQKKMGKRPQEAMFVGPILVGTDGTQKMSKSLNNYIGINETPKVMFQQVMSIPDSALWDYFTLTTDVAKKEIVEMRKACEKGKMNPRDAKIRLGKEIVTMYHSANAAEDAAIEFVQVFANKGFPKDIKTIEIQSSKEILLADVLLDAELVSSKSEARRNITEGGVAIGKVVFNDPNVKIEIIDATKKKSTAVKKKKAAGVKKKKAAKSPKSSVRVFVTSASDMRINRASFFNVSTQVSPMSKVTPLKSHGDKLSKKNVDYRVGVSFSTDSVVVQKGKRHFLRIKRKKVTK